ncbi:MAG: ANTAR domain-containing response regulator, partial [Actinomycetota bacterium]
QKHDLVPAVELAIARWAEARALATESKDLNQRLEARKMVEKAKGKLMEKEGFSESDAFRFIQKAAMRQRMAMKEVAEQILAQS